MLVRKLSFVLLWCFVFTIPWEDTIVSPGVGTLSRLVGIIAFIVGLLTIVITGRMRILNRVHLLMFLTVLAGGMSYFWSVEDTFTLAWLMTSLQLLALAWLVWEFARQQEEQVALMQAYVLGTFLPIAGTIINFLLGRAIFDLRYAPVGFDPNDVGFIMALGIPMAWYISMNANKTFWKWVNRGYIGLALFAILLTASRSAFLAAMVALLIIPWSYPRLSPKNKLMILALIIVSAYSISAFTPFSSWRRLATIQSEVASGTLNARLNVWLAGWEIFTRHVLFGVGAGAFRIAVAMILGRPKVAHNTFLTVLVEQGIFGFVVFMTLIFVLFRMVQKMEPLKHKLWMVLLLTLFTGFSALSWDTRKPVWLLWGLLIAQANIPVKKQAPENSQKTAAGESYGPSA